VLKSLKSIYKFGCQKTNTFSTAIKPFQPNSVGIYERERAIASVSCRQFGTVHLKFYCQLHFGEPLGTQSF